MTKGIVSEADGMYRKTARCICLVLLLVGLFAGCAKTQTDGGTTACLVSDRNDAVEKDENYREKETSGAEGYNQYTAEVKNNGGNYVEYAGHIYFRRYGAESFSQSAIWDNFTPVDGVKSEIVRLGQGGTVERLFTDDSLGRIFIYRESDDKAMLLLTREYVSDGNRGPEVYSVNIDDGGVREYGHGRVFAVDDGRGIIIASTYTGGVDIIDYLTGERKELVENGHIPLYYDVVEGRVYCEDISDADLSYPALCAIDVKLGHERILFCETMDGASDVIRAFNGETYIYNGLCVYEDYISVYLASYDGSAAMISQSLFLRIDKNKGAFLIKEKANPEEWFGEWKPFSFRSENPFQNDTEYADLDGYWIYTGMTEPLELISKQLMSKLGFSDGEYFGEDDFVSLKDVELAGSNLFFTIVTGTREPEEDIGWRYGYRRELSYVYRMDITTSSDLEIKTGAVNMIYSH